MISVYTEMLRSSATDRLGGEALDAIDFLQRAALQMQNLLDGLAELASATSKPLHRSSLLRLDLPLRQALLLLEPELKASGARVSYSDLPLVPGEFDQLQLVFQHLIRNAVRYRDGLPLEIAVSARRTGQEWVVEVRDTGPGVPAEFHERIFELYTRLHGKNIPGNGLGLSICKAILEHHGGRIWLESAAGDGARFCFSLPAT